MKRLIAATGVLTGLLLVVVPRYILPACEYEGYSHMHCSDTAHAEMALGGVLMVAGAFAIALKRPWLVVADAALMCIILVLAWFMPDVYGYCANKNMPCHYGMVPGVRFIIGLAGIVLVSAMTMLARGMRRKKEAL